MGVHGLKSYLHEFAKDLSTVRRFQRSRHAVQVVVDGFGIMFALYLAQLRWEDGGDYRGLWRLVWRLVKAWRAVGVEPVFVFDGATPLAKHTTVVRRHEEKLRFVNKFHRALEARAGNAAIPGDSDNGDDDDKGGSDVDGPGEDVSVSGASNNPDVGPSNGVPTTDALSAPAPSGNRTNRIARCRLMPPLAFDAMVSALAWVKVHTEFVPKGEADAAIVAIADARGAYILGNDSDFVVLAACASNVRGYIPIEGVQWINGRRRKASLLPPLKWATGTKDAWPEPALHALIYTTPALCTHLGIQGSQVALLASIVGNDYTDFATYWLRVREREGMNAPPPYWVVQYTAKIMSGLPLPPLTSEADAVAYVRNVLAAVRGRAPEDRIVDTVVHAMLQYVIPDPKRCCDAAPFCRDSGCSRSSLAGTPTGYAAAQRAGRLRLLTNVFASPDRVYDYLLAEDPAYPTARAAPITCAVRSLAYSIFLTGVAASDTAAAPRDFVNPPVPSVVEYVRNGCRLETFERALRPAPAGAALLPLHERLRLYLSPLGVPASRAIGRLPPYLHPLAAALRICVLLPPVYGEWSVADVRAVARAALGTLLAHDANPGANGGDAQPAGSIRQPALLSNRSVQRVAQLTTALYDLQILASALLLSTPGRIKTHTAVWKFVDGRALQDALAGREPAGAWWVCPRDDDVHAIVAAVFFSLGSSPVDGPDVVRPAPAAGEQGVNGGRNARVPPALAHASNARPTASITAASPSTAPRAPHNAQHQPQRAANVPLHNWPHYAANAQQHQQQQQPIQRSSTAAIPPRHKPKAARARPTPATTTTAVPAPACPPEPTPALDLPAPTTAATLRTPHSRAPKPRKHDLHGLIPQPHIHEPAPPAAADPGTQLTTKDSVPRHRRKR